METNLITMEDMDYLAEQSVDNMNMILAGMTALLDENNEKAEMLGSQTWFRRMSKTISGKNKMTLAEIQQNQDKINLYVTQAMSELFERNCIDQQIMMSLGTRLNELYADHIQLKQMLGAFADKLNRKIISIDNFHMLETEIEQGVYDELTPVAAICKVVSQLDIRTLNDGRKLEILERSLRKHGIISEEPIGISECLMGMLDTSGSGVWLIYMELESLKGNFIADILKQTMEQYHFLSETAKRMKRKERIAKSVIQQNQLDDSAELASEDIYHEFLNAKMTAVLQIKPSEADHIKGGETGGELGDAIGAFLNCDKEGIANLLEPLAEQEDGLALYLMSFLNYLQTDTREKDFLERGHIAGNPMASMRYAKRCQNKSKADAIVQDNIGKLKDMAMQGNMFAQYEYALLFSERSRFKVQQDEAVDVRRLLQASADQGFWVAAYQLAYRCRYGKDGETDYEKSYKLFSKLKQLNVLPAIEELADFYMWGLFVDENKEKAVNLYIKAYECGFVRAKYDLALCCQYGMGVNQDREKAKELYTDYLEESMPEFYYESILIAVQWSNAINAMFEDNEYKMREAEEALNKNIKSIKADKTAANAAYQASCLELEDGNTGEAVLELFVAAKCGNAYALYECAKFIAAKDKDDYSKAYPDSPYIKEAETWTQMLPYNLDMAEYYLEQAKNFTKDEVLLTKIEWLEAKVSIKGAKDVFTDGKNLLKDIFGGW